MTNTLLAIKYSPSPPSLFILDQLLLPHTSTYTQLKSAKDAWSAIRNMNVRGAPAIAIVAALALACEVVNSHTSSTHFQSPETAASFIRNALKYLLTSRPTAVNLADAARKLSSVVTNAVKAALENSENGEQGAASVVNAYVRAAEKMLEDDKRDNLNIGKYGAEWILEKSSQKKVKILTHCNTGSLATSGHGTAIGIIRSLHLMNSLSHTYCTETRPYNQGSRLTAYELVHDKIPTTLVCDSACALLLASQKISQDGGIDAIVVGADRVAANGDTANKIGTCALAILAKAHGTLFIVAAPLTSIDLNISSGSEIVIEERDGSEVTCVSGLLVSPSSSASLSALPNGGPSTKATVHVAAPGVNVWNPAFDVTPAHLIDAIVTERGVFVKRDGCDTYQLAESLQS